MIQRSPDVSVSFKERGRTFLNFFGTPYKNTRFLRGHVPYQRGVYPLPIFFVPYRVGEGSELGGHVEFFITSSLRLSKLNLLSISGRIKRIYKKYAKKCPEKPFFINTIFLSCHPCLSTGSEEIFIKKERN